MKATREQCFAMAGRSKGRLMHDENQHELICFTPEQLEAFAHKVQQFTLDQLREQGAALTIKQPKYDMREPKTESLYRIPETLE